MYWRKKHISHYYGPCAYFHFINHERNFFTFNVKQKNGDLYCCWLYDSNDTKNLICILKCPCIQATTMIIGIKMIWWEKNTTAYSVNATLPLKSWLNVTPGLWGILLPVKVLPTTSFHLTIVRLEMPVGFTEITFLSLILPHICLNVCLVLSNAL